MRNLFTFSFLRNFAYGNGPMMDRQCTDEVAEKSARMSTVWTMLWVKLVNLVNLVMQIFKLTKLTKLTEQIFDESLKCLMQFFVESAESAKSARSIFATFATFASANFVGKESCESTVRYRVKSRIPSCYLRSASVIASTRIRLASLICLCMLPLGVGNAWGATYTYDFTKGSSTSYWTSDNSSTSVGTSNISTFYYMQNGYSGHCFTAGNGSTNTHNHRFNTTKNSECFFLGKTGEYLTLPTYSGQKITSVQIYGNTQGSSSATVNIYASGTAVSTAAAIYDTNNTFAINSDYQASTLSVKLTNSNNAGITKIIITTAVDGCDWSETFSLCGSTGGNDGSWSGSIAGGTFAADNTWTTTNAKAANKCAKFGTTSAGGSAQTPTLTGLLGTLTVKFKAGAWNAASEGTTLNLATTQGTLSQSSVTLSKGSWTNYKVTITGVTTATKITFSTDGGNKRFFLDDVCVFEGTDCADPTAPTNSSVSGTGVTISTSSSSANYDIYYSTTSTTPTTQDPTATITSGNSKAITGLNYGTTYYYWMRTNCGSSTSNWVAGSPTSFTTTVPAPTGVSAGSLSMTGATISITDANNVNSYDVYCSESSTAPEAGTTPSASGTSKSIAVTGLTAGRTYYYWARAKGPNAKSTWYGGSTFTTLTLSSISVSTAPTKTKYLVGDNFDPTALVITRTFSDKSSDTYTCAGHTAEFSFSPSSSLTAGTSKAITITYGGETTTTNVDVYSVTVNKVNMSGTAISNASVTASCSGRTLSQSVGSTNYKFEEYAVTAGGVDISGSTITGTPTGNVTINAKFHDPITVTWLVGSGAASGSPTGEVKYGTAITTLPTKPADNALSSCGTNKFMGWSASELIGTGYSAPADLFTDASGAANLTANTTYRAVFAKSSAGGSGNIQLSYTSLGLTTSYESGSTKTVSGIDFYCNDIMTGASGQDGYQKIQFKKSSTGPGYIYNSEILPGNITSIVFGSTTRDMTVNFGISSNPDGSTETKTCTSSSLTATPTGNYKYFKILNSVDNAAYTGTITINYSSVSYSDYQTGCCTELGEPATLELEQTAYTIKATWTAAGGNETGYSVQLYDNSGGEKGSEIGDPVSRTSSQLTYTFEDLTANHKYYVGVTPTYSGAGDYCATGTEKLVSVTTDQVYTVTYNSGGGSGTITDSNSPYEAGDEVTVKENTFTKSGYTFTAWSYSPEVTVTDGKFDMPSSNVEITATWTAKKNYYIDRMHGNCDGVNTVTIGGVVYNCYLREGAGYTRPDLSDNDGGTNDCVTGHEHFIGWVAAGNVAADGSYSSGTIYAGGSSGTATNDGTIYYAVWAEE